MYLYIYTIPRGISFKHFLQFYPTCCLTGSVNCDSPFFSKLNSHFTVNKSPPPSKFSSNLPQHPQAEQQSLVKTTTISSLGHTIFDKQKKYRSERERLKKTVGYFIIYQKQKKKIKDLWICFILYLANVSISTDSV